MNMKIKLLSLLLALTCLGAVFVGCDLIGDSADDDSGKDTSNESQSEGESESQSEDAEELIIAADGKTDFCIWVERTLWNNPDIKEQVNVLNSVIKDKTGVSLSAEGDRYFEEADEEKPAILIGKTKSSATPTPDTSMKIGDFIIGMTGNKIYIYAEHIEGCVTALEYFSYKVLTPQDSGEKTLVFNKSEHSIDYVENYDIKSIRCLGKELGEYKIVIPSGCGVNEELFAYTLRYYLVSRYGYDLEVVTDSTAESANEILIGKTSRTTVAPDKNEYIVSAGDGKLQLCADGMLGYENMLSYVKNDLIAATPGAEYTVNEGFVENGEAVGELANGTSFVTNRSGDVRYMVYNVYGYGEGGPMYLRQQLQAEMIKGYLPDVIGFQEYTASYHTNMTPVLTEELGYTQVAVDTGEYANFTPMFYRSDKLTLKDSGFFIHTNKSDDLSKTNTWGLFETADGKQFIAITGHFMWDGDEDEPDFLEVRKDHARQIVALKDELKKQYNVPVLFGGDLNCTVSSDPVTILREGGLELAFNTAPEANKNNNNGHHKHASYDATNKYFNIGYTPKGQYSASIDHIFTTDDASVVGFGTLSNLYTTYGSDHSPLIVEISLS